MLGPCRAEAGCGAGPHAAEPSPAGRVGPVSPSGLPSSRGAQRATPRDEHGVAGASRFAVVFARGAQCAPATRCAPPSGIRPAKAGLDYVEAMLRAAKVYE
jgi:hypothetical protein